MGGLLERAGLASQCEAWPLWEPALMVSPSLLLTGGSRCERRRLGQTPEETLQ